MSQFPLSPIFPCPPLAPPNPLPMLSHSIVEKKPKLTLISKDYTQFIGQKIIKPTCKIAGDFSVSLNPSSFPNPLSTGGCSSVVGSLPLMPETLSSSFYTAEKKSFKYTSSWLRRN